MFKSEILAPGGSFNSTLHAFEAGADAIYAGMSSFSARKGAANFTIERLRRLKSYCAPRGKKIYIAINTVIREREMAEVIELLYELSEIAVDGIILQDPGLAYILRKHFPALPIHASTQMAIHNSRGVGILKEAGFSRVILARELTLEEIARIREDQRDVELEVFIHGAMCYSFSGICLASGQLLGRSGNRGECGQICRTWFDDDGQKRYAFSANDLKAGEEILKLQKMGIESLKIEGRLKSPAYVSRTVKYYKAILEGKNSQEISREETLSSIAFSRDQQKGFLTNPKGTEMINGEYASHTGLTAGKVLSQKNGKVQFTTELEISDRDGLLILQKGKTNQFALKSTGKKNHYAPGEIVEFFFKDKISPGTKISLVSRHDQQMKEYKEETFKPWKSPLDLDITLQKSQISIQTSTHSGHFSIERELDIEESHKEKDIEEILHKTFSQSGDSFFTIASLSFHNQTEYDQKRVFIPLGKLKEIRREFYFSLQEQNTISIAKKREEILTAIEEEQKEPFYPELSRSEMKPQDSLVPFGWNTQQWLTIPPLQFSESDFQKLEEDIEEKLNQVEGPISIGINNISHISLVKKYIENPRILFFVDYCLYGANRAFNLFFQQYSDRFLFSYQWIEDKDSPLPPFVQIERDFNPHLFVSRICYRRHNHLGACRNCAQDFNYELKQRDRVFTVIVKNCLTWLFQKE